MKRIYFVLLFVLSCLIFSSCNFQKRNEGIIDDNYDITHLDGYDSILTDCRIDNYMEININVCLNKKIIFRCISKKIGINSAICFINSLYNSPEYIIGATEFVEQTWRFPPCLEDDNITIFLKLNDSSLFIKKLVFYYEDEEIDFLYDNNIKFNAHLGFSEMCPENTVSGVEMAGLLGYDSCIVVPKVTYDGKLVCIHDDTINRTAMKNNCIIDETKNVSDMRYNELLELDFGSYKNKYWKDEKILTVDEFFKTCKKYDMSPIFSTHPRLSLEKWKEVKELLVYYDLLDKFIVKSFDLDILNLAFTVFGNEILGYTGDNFSVEQMNDFATNNMIDKSKTKLSIETNYLFLDENIIKLIKAEGYDAQAFTLNSNVSENEIRKYISWGITEFTDDTYCQNGMLFLNF